ncbi:hypothetical protein [Ruminococcus albus]|uniref:Uncharacterized protein n=1 Tax=Ruminococcus albus (strain ATCC 27210 / DSM 20455 / JCM 14654 / NCDO 2250 / 7) TaxID=697329 RepID=E6UB88_RUMA7|nr:hypothetical protein [Ruminococcus albus]ADU21438.1 hypothetical protein Rumal_0912 [Ruminococcus albus 7 = DSM 20455]
MNRPKLTLTPVQLGLTLLNSAGLIFCAAGDMFLLMFDRGTVKRGTVISNLALAVLTGIICVVLMFKAGDIDLFDKDEYRDKQPAVSALRTYFCMLTLDITVVLIMMLTGAMFWNSAGRAIAITAPLLFLFSGTVYYLRTREMGGDDIADDPVDPEDDEKAALMKAADDIIAEGKRPRTAEDILAKAKAEIGADAAEDDMENGNGHIQDN